MARLTDLNSTRIFKKSGPCLIAHPYVSLVHDGCCSERTDEYLEKLFPMIAIVIGKFIMALKKVRRGRQN